MTSKAANITAILIAAVAIYVVADVYRVLSGAGEDRYKGVIKQPSSLVKNTTDPAPVETIAVESGELIDEESVSEVVTEPVEALSDVVSEAVIEEETPINEVVESVEEVVETVTPTIVSGEAQVHVVTAEGLVYNPLVVAINPGDTVAWENMSSHDTQSMEGLIPDGAEMWHSAMGENYQRTFTVEGIYVYKCTPHFGAGMGGGIIVGQPVNLDAIKAVPAKGAAKRLVKKALQVAEAM